MKTKEEITAEIAQGVRDATRQRASERLRKEKRASFYYKVSYLILTGSGVGGFSTLLSKGETNWYFISLGVITAIAFAIIADQTLKS